MGRLTWGDAGTAFLPGGKGPEVEERQQEPACTPDEQGQGPAGHFSQDSPLLACHSLQEQRRPWGLGDVLHSEHGGS